MGIFKLKLTGLTCQGCVGRVRQRLQSMAGVTAVEVSLLEAQVTASASLTEAEINSALAEVGGYRAVVVPPAAVEAATAQQSPVGANVQLPRPSTATYRPLLLILAYLLAAVGAVLVAHGRWDAGLAMRLFMGGFFLVFSFFKLLDVAAFARAYAGYDLVAKAWPGYGKLYPFIELGLGLAYLAHWQPLWVNGATALLMAVSLIGVVRAVLAKQEIRCACLGTVFQLPMSTVTIVEDAVMLGMALMALALGC